MKLLLLCVLTLTLASCSKKYDKQAAILDACKQGELVAMVVLQNNGVGLTPTQPIEGKELQRQADEMCLAYAAEVLK